MHFILIVPIEDGVPFFIGIGLIYGAFKLRDALRKMKEKNNGVDDERDLNK